jgi:pimeloyl-ACP methyl ester carboxylesterase
MQVRGADAEIYYELLGRGPDLVLLHPFPANHGIWMPVAEQLAARHRVLIPDLRGHGRSGAGEGPATMEKHAADVLRACDDAGIKRAVFAGESIGGYILFEFWRRFPDRVSALVLCNTRAQADTPEARAGRLRSAEEVEKRGVEPFVETMIPKLLGESTRRNRPDLADAARRMMMEMTPAGIAAALRGMAERPDSTETLSTINVPTLVVTGDEDVMTGAVDAEFMRRRIVGSEAKVIPHAGHYAVFEQAGDAARLLRQFLAACASGHARV